MSLARIVARRAGADNLDNADNRRAYELSYQPDWVSEIAVTQSVGAEEVTTTLLKNPGYKEQAPGAVVRTRINAPEQGLDFEVR